MSSEILAGGEPRVAPPFWRTVATARVDGRNESRADETHQAAEQARREAFEQGFTAGRKDAEQQILPALGNIAVTTAELARLREKIREETLQDLVRLSTKIAERVIHREVVIDPDALAGLVKAAYAKAQVREIRRLKVHPSIEALVRRCLEQANAPKNLEIVSDAALQPGELFLETAQGTLDASVETQLREIERGLIDRLEP